MVQAHPMENEPICFMKLKHKHEAEVCFKPHVCFVLLLDVSIGLA
jgi:hypothetical protein